MKRLAVLTFTGLITMSGCLTEARAQAPGAVVAALDGVWVTDGYGYVFEIEAGRIQGYDVTAVSCLLTLSGEVIPPDGDLMDARPGEATDAVVSSGGVRGSLRMHIHPGATANEKWFHPEYAVSSMAARRVAERPAICDSPPDASPEAVFGIFWQTFQEHYPFFAMKDIDWAAVGEQYRPRVTAETTDDELAEILALMLEPLEDAHVGFDTDDGIRYRGRRPGPNRLTQADRQRTVEILESEYLTEPLRRYCTGPVAYSRLEPGIGYLRVSGFSNYATEGGWRAGLICLNSALDEIFGGADSLRGLVIDVRLNGGGSDHYGIQIAHRLTGREYLAYTKETLNPVDGTWLPGQPSRVRPAGRPGFRGPVVLLTGRNSVSGAETFAMALMGREPEITRVGENTQGVFSDTMGRALPNGWRFRLPNEQFLTAGGNSFDGPGVPPHVAVPVFPRDDLTAGRDSAIEKALELLR